MLRLTMLAGTCLVLMGQGGSTSHTLDPEILARVEGRAVTRGQYLEFLYQRYHRSDLRALVDQILVERRARELGIEVDEAVLNAVVERELDDELRHVYGGDRTRFERALSERFFDPESYRQWTTARLHTRVLGSACIRSLRTVTAEQVSERFEQLFGVGGVSRRFRHLFLSRERDRTGAGEEAAYAGLGAFELITVVAAVVRRSPERFEELIDRFTDDPVTGAAHGLVSGYQPGADGFGFAFDDALRQLDSPGRLSPTIETDRGYHLIQLVSIHHTRLEDVESDIREALRLADPTGRERARFQEGLRREATLEW